MAEATLTADALNALPPGERRSAIASLVAEPGPGVVTLLSGALGQSNWPVCNELADALAEIGGDAAHAALAEALTARRHHVRSAAVKALVRVGGVGVRDAIERLADDPSYEVGQDVQEALRRLSSDEGGEAP